MNEFEDIKKNIELLKQKEKDVFKTLQNEQDEIVRLKSLKNDLDEHILNLNKTLEQYSDKNIKLNHEIIEKEKLNSNLIKRNTELLNSISVLENKKLEIENNSISSLNELKKKTEEIKQKNELSIKDGNNQIIKFDKIIESKKSIVSLLEVDISYLTTRKSVLSNDILNKEDFLLNLTNRVDKLSKEMIDIEQKTASLQEKYSLLNSNIQNINSEIETLEKEKIDKDSVLNALVVDIKNKEDEYKNATKRILDISVRENNLNRKEVAIKAKFEQAGIKYE